MLQVRFTKNTRRVLQRESSSVLNLDQLAVLASSDGARSVAAGPGSGKSTTMVAFIQSLLDRGVSASEIRALTFSREMALALEKKLKVKGVVSTFHSLGYLICSETERKPVEPELRHRLMCKLIRRFGLDYKALDHFIARMRRQNITPQQALDGDHDLSYVMAKAYSEYERVRAEEGWMDFDSMLADAVQSLEKPSVRARWQPRYLIVDEAQDTDDCQWRMMQLMAERHGNITVVGDPNQCQPAGTQILMLADAKSNICAPGDKRRLGWKKAQFITKDISELKNGDQILSWTRHEQRVYHTPRPIQVASRHYAGDLVSVESNDQVTQTTPNHYFWVRFSSEALEPKKHFVYLMWREDLGFRIGTSHVRHTRSGGCFLTHRFRQEKAQKMWILTFAETKQEAETLEEMYSLKYRIPECVFHCYSGSKKTDAQIQRIFACAAPDGGGRCLDDFGLLFNEPIIDVDRKKFHFRGYFKIAAANLIAGLMALPTPQINGSAIITRVSRRAFDGMVYSLDVATDHTYIADGIPVGNCIYGFRGAKPDNITNFQQWFPNGKKFFLGKNYRSTQNIVKFVRENAPGDTPQELLDRMVASRADVGVPIDFKMYWSEEQEAESALALANKDPLQSIILARTNRMVGLLERICNKHNVRYHLMGKTGFWKQNEIRKAIDLLKNYPTLETAAAMSLALPGLVAKYAVDDRTERDNDAIENLGVLRVIGKDFRLASDFTTYANKMQHRRNDPKGVSISTVHQAKGLEFRNVFLIGVNAKSFPHPKGDPREEKRIYFVAISRAADFLRISFSGTPSPYLRRYLTEDILDRLREHAEEVDHLQAQHKLLGII